MAPIPAPGNPLLQRTFPYLAIAMILPVLMAVPAKTARAQAAETVAGNRADAPFGTLRVELDGGWSAATGSFTENWEPRPVLGLTLSSPFYAGELKAGIRYSRFRNNPGRNAYSDFHSLYIQLGWGLPLSLGRGTTLLPAVSIGNTYLQYDDPMSYSAPGASWSYTFDTSESEISYELSLELHHNLGGGWGVLGGISYNRTLTYHPLEITLFRAGISRTLDSPGWLRDFLR